MSPPSAMFRFVPENVAARAVSALADARGTVLRDLGELPRNIKASPVSVVVLGSFARSEADSESGLAMSRVLGEPPGDTVRALVHEDWQRQVVDALRQRGWHPPRHASSGGPVPWEEVASTAVEAVWADVERIIAPLLDVISRSGLGVEHAPKATAAPEPSDALWLSADEVAPLLRTTAHSLRRLAREHRSPVPVQRIGGRWWFARAEVDRFLGRRAD
jgi:lambda repressor-like predicted transcriptional regulator